MKFIISLVFLIISIHAEDNYTKEDNVVVLTDDNFDNFIETHEHVLVKFYATFCKYSKMLAPEFSKAAAVLEKESLYLAQVDAMEQQKLFDKFFIRGFPTIKLFSRGETIDYPGKRLEKDIIDWMRQKTINLITPVKTEEEVKKLINENEFLIIYFGEDEKVIKDLEKIALRNQDILFRKCNDKNIFEKYNVKLNTIVLFKHVDEERNDLTNDLSFNNIERFLYIYTNRLVMPFDEKTIKLIFLKKNPAIILYIDNDSPKRKEYFDLLDKLARDYREKLQFSITDIKEGDQKKLADFIGVTQEDLPAIQIADTRVGVKKYKLEGDITEENIRKFIKDWEDNKLPLFLKSQEIPLEQNKDIYHLVGKTYNQFVLNSDKDVFVNWYAPHLQDAKYVQPLFEKLATKLKNNDKLFIAEIDGTKNDVEDIYITGFPTIMFYPAGKKDQPIDYREHTTMKDFISFIKKYATYPIDYQEEEEKKENADDAKKEDIKEKDEKKENADDVKKEDIKEKDEKNDGVKNDL